METLHWTLSLTVLCAKTLSRNDGMWREGRRHPCPRTRNSGGRGSTSCSGKASIRISRTTCRVRFLQFWMRDGIIILHSDPISFINNLLGPCSCTLPDAKSETSSLLSHRSRWWRSLRVCSARESSQTVRSLRARGTAYLSIFSLFLIHESDTSSWLLFNVFFGHHMHVLDYMGRYYSGSYNEKGAN
jgi:hypothetical protein